MSSLSPQLRRIITAGWLGTLLEWYDFAVYAYLVPSIAQLFFPSGHHGLQLLLTYSVFAIGYLIRPLGGLLFGSLGDRIGRKPTFLATIWCMTLPTILIGLLPTYQVIGWFAPCALVLLRLCQGLAAGGELSGSVILVYESAPKHRKALFTAWLFIGSGCGVLLASWVISILHYYSPHQLLMGWAWRVPFLLAIIGAVLSIWLRYQAYESESFTDAKKHQRLIGSPLISLFTHQKKLLFQVMMLFAPGALLFYLNFIFLPSWLVASHTFSPSIMVLNSFATMLLLVCSMGSAWLADRVSQAAVIVVALILIMVFAVVFCIGITAQSWLSWSINQFVLAIIFGGLTGPLMAFVLGNLAISTRYSALATAYNIAYSIFGSTAPVLALCVLQASHRGFFYIGLYLFSLTLICLCVVLRLSNSSYPAIDHSGQAA